MAFPQMFILATTLLALVACRSDPIQFHTLAPAQPVGTMQAGGVDVEIEAITVPPQMDRQQIVIRQSNSSLAILDTRWWGASLAEELRSALAQQLSSNSGGRKVTVRLDVQRFDTVPGQYVLIDVKWRLRNLSAGNEALVHCRSILQTPAGVSIDDAVMAHQDNLKRLAEEINQTAGNAAGGCRPQRVIPEKN